MRTERNIRETIQYIPRDAPPATGGAAVAVVAGIDAGDGELGLEAGRCAELKCRVVVHPKLKREAQAPVLRVIVAGAPWPRCGDGADRRWSRGWRRGRLARTRGRMYKVRKQRFTYVLGILG